MRPWLWRVIAAGYLSMLVSASCLGMTRTICGVDLRSTQYGAFDHLKDVRLDFSDGSTEGLTMAKSDERQSFRFRPHATEWVIVHLLSTYGDGAGGINVNSSGTSEVALYELADPSKPGGRTRPVKLTKNCVQASDDAGWDTNWSVQNVVDGNWGTPPYYPNQQWMARNIGAPGKSVWCRIDFEPRRTSLGVPIPLDAAAVSESGAYDPQGEWGASKIVDGVWASDSTPNTQWKVDGFGRQGEEHWCRISFGREREVFEIDLQDSRFPGSSRVKDVRVEFSNGQSRHFTLADTDDRQILTFEPTKTRWMKIHLLSAYGGKPDASGGLAEVAIYEPRDTPRPGIYDLNKDGVPDLLVFYWRDHLTAFISDRGRLPWTTDLNRDWDRYFSRAFNIGSKPPVTWNPERSNWGSYTLLCDLNSNGRFDDISVDYWYQVVDLDGDGDPDMERADRAHPELGLHIQKYFYDLDDDNHMNYIDWAGPQYGDEQMYTGESSYLQDTAGNGFFSLVFEKERSTFYPDIRAAWENPIAFYDLDDDGRTEQVVRETDAPWDGSGRLREVECAFDIDNSGSKSSPSSLDIQLSWLGVQNKPFDYSKYVEDFPQFRGLPEADFLFGRRLYVRHQTVRMWMPYFDAYKIGTELDALKWNSAFLLIDEDDDDVRWEEMFSPHEFSGGSTPLDKHVGYDDHIGDRWESDDNYDGGGKLYIGKFDGRMHLYKADRAEWTIDYRALFKGSLDRPQEAPAPPDGLLYSLVCYYDTDGNGFIDKIVYGEKRVGDDGSFKTVREVNLLDFATPANPHPDVCELFDIKTSDKLTGRKVSEWSGGKVSHLRNEAYDRLRRLFAKTAESRWSDAVRLYQAARDSGLISTQEPAPLPADAMKVNPNDHQSVLRLTDIRVTPNCTDVLHPRTEWQTYRDAYFLAESTFAVIRARAPKEKLPRLSTLYYSGQLRALADEVDRLRSAE